MSYPLTPESLKFLAYARGNSLLKSRASSMCLARVLLKLLPACSDELKAEQDFHLTYKPKLISVIDTINEVAVIDRAAVLDCVGKLYCWTSWVASQSRIGVSGPADRRVQMHNFFGLSRWFDQATLQELDQTSIDLDQHTQGFIRLCDDLLPKDGVVF